MNAARAKVPGSRIGLGPWPLLSGRGPGNQALAGAGMEYDDEALRRYLDGRLQQGYLDARLEREPPGGEPVFDSATWAFHPENLRIARAGLRLALRAGGLYRRGQRNARTLRVRHHDLALPGLSDAMSGFRLLQISDLHVDVDPEFGPALAEQLRHLSWDACVITGDFRYRTNGDFTPALSGFEHISRVLQGPVYAILGNHDSIRMVPHLEGLGTRVLMNEGVHLGDDHGRGVWLAGVDDPHFYRQHDIPRALADRPEDWPALLLAHSPEAYREAASAGADAMLCGHTHGGQIRLPGGVPLVTNADCPREFTSGAWRWQTLQGYTSVGAGSSVLDVRYNCPAEVVLHRLMPRPPAD